MADHDFTLEQLRVQRDEYTRALLAPLTRKGYRHDWQTFCGFTDSMGLVALPASVDTVGLFVTSRLSSGHKPSSVTRQIAAIARAHRDHGLPGPAMGDIRAILRGARRMHPQAEEQVIPLSIADLRAISTELASRDTPIAVRDRTILLVGFASALRSASLVELHLDDVEFVEQGVVLRIRVEKQDQEGMGRFVGLPHGKHQDTCPVEALKGWLGRRGTFPGYLFTRMNNDASRRDTPLQAEQICRIVQAALRHAGRSSRGYGSHSMRAGLISEAGLAGLTDWQISTQSGHATMSVLRKYFRKSDVFKQNVLAELDI